MGAGIIGLLAATTSPLFSVGIHFLVWHAWREMWPLARTIGGRTPRDLRSLGVSLRGIHAAALPLLVPTWAACAVVWWLLPAPRLEHSAHGVDILSLVTYLIVTPAHAVAWQLARAWARHHLGEASAHGIERAGRRGLQMPSAPV